MPAPGKLPAAGYFTARNLPVGGPYTVEASDTVHVAKTVDVPSIPLGAPYEMSFSLAGGAVAEVVVTAARRQPERPGPPPPPL